MASTIVKSSGVSPELLVCLDSLLVSPSVYILTNLVATFAVLFAAMRVSLTLLSVSSMAWARFFRFLNIFKFLFNFFF